MNANSVAAAGFLGLVLATAAAAHAMLDRAVPPVGTTLNAAPERIELWFSERLEPAFSSLKVTDASGHQVDRHDAAVDDGDRRHFVVSLTPLPRGRYRVVWRAVSVDTHVTAGNFVFDVGP